VGRCRKEVDHCRRKSSRWRKNQVAAEEKVVAGEKKWITAEKKRVPAERNRSLPTGTGSLRRKIGSLQKKTGHCRQKPARCGHGASAGEEGRGEWAVQPASGAARMYILLGEYDKALDLLEPLLKIPYYLSPGWLKTNPTFAPLRGNPRFERLVSGS
jgi:hypothetical protein